MNTFPTESKEKLAEEIIDYYEANENLFDGELLSTIIEMCWENVSEEYRKNHDQESEE